MIKAVLFDLNGVFIHSPKFSERFEKTYGVPVAEFLPVLMGIMDKVRLPSAPDVYAYFTPYLVQWKVDLNREQFFDFWFGAEEAFLPMLAIAHELRSERLKLIIISNNFRERTDYYDNNLRFLRDAFDSVYYSWRTGFMKPDPKYYRLVLDEQHLKPVECLYFDDVPENVETAKKLGLHAFIYQGPEFVRRTVKEYQKKFAQ